MGKIVLVVAGIARPIEATDENALIEMQGTIERLTDLVEANEAEVEQELIAIETVTEVIVPKEATGGSDDAAKEAEVAKATGVITKAVADTAMSDVTRTYRVGQFLDQFCA